MSDLLEMLLNFVLELLCDGWDLAPYWESWWHLGLPMLGALAVVLLIRWTVSNSVAQFILSAPVAVAGLTTGIVWQMRKG